MNPRMVSAGGSSEDRKRDRIWTLGGPVGVLALLTALLGSDATASGGAPAVPERLAGEVREQLARDWGVRPETVLLEWGSLSDSLAREGEIPFRFFGKGAGGQFVLTTRSVAGRNVALSLRAGVLDTLMVATRPLQIGTRIAAGDIRPEAMPVWGRPARSCAGPGWEVMRALAEGEPVTRPAVAPPLSVEKGKTVQFEWARGGLRITIAGIALHSARVGESVRARVAGRREPVEGIVTGLGLATLEMEKAS